MSHWAGHGLNFNITNTEGVQMVKPYGTTCCIETADAVAHT